MQQFQIDGWRNIIGSTDPNDPGDRMPTVTEDKKLPQWKELVHSHVYNCIANIILDDINEVVTTLEPYDNYLVDVSQEGTLATFLMRNGATHTLDLLSDPFELVLPGNTKVLFDDNNTIGGSSNFTYNKSTKEISLVDVSISARDSKFSQSSYSNILQFLGSSENGSILLDSYYKKNITINNTFNRNIGIGKNTLYSALNETDTIAIGTSTFYSLNNATGGVAIGAYAGKYETNSHTLYIDDEDFGTASNSRTHSLLYGDFSNDFLRVNGKLRVEEEIRIGEFSRDTAEYGMLAIEEIVGGTTFEVPGVGTKSIIRPKYFNGIEWKYFDGEDTYLSSIVQSNAAPTVLNDDYTVEFVVSGQPSVYLQLPTPITSHGTDVRVQISDGIGGFISYSGLEFTNSSNILKVGRGLTLPLSDISYAGSKVTGTIITTSVTENGATVEHAYCWLNGQYKQLDNNAGDIGQVYSCTNIGNSYNIFADVEDDGSFGFRTLTAGTGIHLEYTAGVPGDYHELTISSTYSLLINSPVDANSARLYKIPVLDAAANVSTIDFRKIRATDASIIIDDTNPDFIGLRAVSGAEAVTLTMANIGTGEYIYKETVLSTVNFKGILGSSYITVDSDASDLDVIISAKDLYSSISEEIVVGNTSLIYANTVETDLTKSLQLISLVGAGSVSLSTPDSHGTVTITGVEYSTISPEDFTYVDDVIDEVKLTINLDGVPAISLGSFVLGTGLSGTIVGGKVVISATGEIVTTDKYLTDVIGGAELVPELYGAQGTVYGVNYIDNIDFGIVDIENSSRKLGFIVDNIPINFSGFGWLAFQDFYNDATYEDKGILSVNNSALTIADGVLSANLATDAQLGVVQIGSGIDVDINGVISVDFSSTLQDSVFFTTQYALHDGDEYNAGTDPDTYETTIGGPYTLPQRVARREVARANIGAAYVNGTLLEHFSSNDFTADGIITASIVDSNRAHQLSNIFIHGNVIAGVYPGAGIILSSQSSQMEGIGGTKVQLGATHATFDIDNSSGDGMIRFRKYENGSYTTMFKFDINTGNLYVKGEIHSGADIEAFDTDINIGLS